MTVKHGTSWSSIRRVIMLSFPRSLPSRKSLLESPFMLLGDKSYCSHRDLNAIIGMLGKNLVLKLTGGVPGQS